MNAPPGDAPSLAPARIETAAATLLILGIATASAVALAAAAWRVLAGPVPGVVPAIAAIVTPIVALPLILYLQHAIRRLSASQRALTELTRRLSAATSEAELASRAKTDFLARMSHELRTPLNAVIGYSEILLEDAPEGLSASQIADLKRINSAGKHLLSMVNDVLDLSKIEAGRMDVTVQPIELGKFLDDLAATSRRLVTANGNEFFLERPEDLGMVEGDATKLRQIVLNLLSNAAKFTQQGRITLAVAREAHPAGDWIRIDVRDTGIGIEREALTRLFTNFTQAGPAIAGKYGGTGLGLALSRRLCRLMGGDISAESAPGGGSCFTLRIPASLRDHGS
jgi:signal transduction histidine kinase